MKIKNAKHVADGLINCDYEHPVLGWIPFTASPNDVEQIGRDIYALAASGDVAPMAEPTNDEKAAKAKRLKNIADEEAAKADAKVQAFADMSPSDVRQWIGKNVKTLDDAKDVLATLAVAVSVLTRKL